MVLIGILFIIMGLIFMLSEVFKAYRENAEIVIKRKKVDIENWFVRYKMLLGILSTVLGLFSIINYIVY